MMSEAVMKSRSGEHQAENLAERFRAVGRPKIFVLGDLMLDRATWGEAGRISPEAPVLVLDATRTEESLGGAASVAMLLRGLDAEVRLAGVVGADLAGSRVRTLLAGLGVDAGLVRDDPARPTTTKDRLIGVAGHRHAHQLIRWDFESRAPIPPGVEGPLLAEIDRAVAWADAVLISDYAKGVVTPRLAASAIDSARRRGRPVLVDPGRGVDYARYRHASAITPNRAEAGEATGVPIDSITAARAAAVALRSRLDLDAALVTLDRDGMVYAHGDAPAEHIPGRPRQVYDITGAGDMVLAMLGLALGAGLGLADAVVLANAAGGLEVEAVGVCPIARAAVLADLTQGPGAGRARPRAAKVLTTARLVGEVESRRRRGERLVLTNGCFDLFHPGHLQTLTAAAQQGDCLVVAVNSDTSIRRLKGPDRPIVPEADRLAMVAALEVVDLVTLLDADTPEALVAAIRPDVLIKGGDYRAEAILGGDTVRAAGGSVVVAPYRDGWSTTRLVGQLADPLRPDLAAAGRDPALSGG